MLQLIELSVVILAHTWPMEEILSTAHGRQVYGDTYVADLTTTLADQFKEEGMEAITAGPIHRRVFDVASTLSRQIAFDHDERAPRDAPRRTWDTIYLPSMTVLLESAHSIMRPDLIQCSTA